jgi:hypothetical protein
MRIQHEDRDRSRRRLSVVLLVLAIVPLIIVPACFVPSLLIVRMPLLCRVGRYQMYAIRARDTFPPVAEPLKGQIFVFYRSWNLPDQSFYLMSLSYRPK